MAVALRGAGDRQLRRPVAWAAALLLASCGVARAHAGTDGAGVGRCDAEEAPGVAGSALLQVQGRRERDVGQGSAADAGLEKEALEPQRPMKPTESVRKTAPLAPWGNANVTRNFTNSSDNSSSTVANETATKVKVPTHHKMLNLAHTAMSTALGAARAGLKNFKNISKVVDSVKKALKVKWKILRGHNLTSDVMSDLHDSVLNTSAEAAAANNMLLTATDVADHVGGGVRGEDLGVAPDGSNNTFQGDMVPENSTQLLLFQEIEAGHRKWVAAGRPWRGCRVAYCFARDVSANVRFIFEAATRQYKAAVPCLQFVDVGWKQGYSDDSGSNQLCRESPAIFVISRKNAGCYSYVGMLQSYKSQQLQLHEPGCMSIGTAIHELGHALGMAHEQSRPDRDRHVHVNFNNIDADKRHNFEIDKDAYTGIPYDFLSVMHYDAYAFARDRHIPTLESAETGHEDMGNRAGLSRSDAEQVASMYVPENSGCQAKVLQGLGCVNKVNDRGQDVCESLSQCRAADIEACCACGGGVKVQCYEGEQCPSHTKLPPPAGGECIQDKTGLDPSWRASHGCVFTNACSFKVRWQCPDSPCEHTTAPGGLWHMKCNGKVEMQICEQGVCTVSKA